MIVLRYILKGMREKDISVYLTAGKTSLRNNCNRISFPISFLCSALRINTDLTHDREYVQPFILCAKYSVFHYAL